MNLPSCIQIHEPLSGYPVLHVQHRNATGTIALHGVDETPTPAAHGRDSRSQHVRLSPWRAAIIAVPACCRICERARLAVSEA